MFGLRLLLRLDSLPYAFLMLENSDPCFELDDGEPRKRIARMWPNVPMEREPLSVPLP